MVLASAVFFLVHTGRSEPVHSAEKGKDSLDETYSRTGYEPNAYDLKETYVESYTESLTHSSPSKGSPRTSSTMTPHSRICFVKHTEYMSITPSEKACLSVSRRRLCPERTGRSVGERTGRLVESIGQELNVANAQIRTLLDRQKKRFLAECQGEVGKHEFQADYDRRSVRKLGEIIESQQEELHCAQAEELQRRDQQLLHGQLLQQNSESREAHQKSLNEMEELKKFQSSTFDTVARRRLVEDQDTILELTGKIQD